MDSVWEAFKEGGWPNWIILLLGLPGVMIGVVALALAATRGRSARLFGAAAVLYGALIAGLGLGGTALGRRAVDDALAGGSVHKSQVERIRRAGYAESLSCVRFGLGFAALPILAGAAAMFAGTGRKKRDAEPAPRPWTDEPPQGDPLPPPLPSAAPEDASGAGLPMFALSFAGLMVAAGFVVLSRPLPGREIDDDDLTAKLVAAKESIHDGDLDIGCDELEEALDADHARPGAPPTDTTAVPDFKDICSACIDFKITKAVTGDPDDRVPELALLLRSKIPMTDEQAERIKQSLTAAADDVAPKGAARPSEDSVGSIAGADPSASGSAAQPDPSAGATGSAPEEKPKARSGPAKVNTGAAQVNGRLPPEVISRIVRQSFGRFRLCYENGLRNNPDLKGRVSVRFVIGRDGAVTNAANAGSDLPDAGVVACVVRAFYGLSFPQPEGGIVTVTYPLSFASS